MSPLLLPHVNPHPCVDRREFLQRLGMGMGMVGLSGLLGGTLGRGAETELNPLAPQAPQFPAKAKRVIHIFANGGPSQVDTFDPKPELTKWNGKRCPNTLRTERKTGAAFASPFCFKKYGQSGIEVSEIFSKVGECADDLCVIRSMHADVPNHEPSFLLMNCGEARLPRPSMGSWVTYGLGSENQNLPGFITMCPGGLPTSESANWQSAFLPGIYQGTYINTANSDPDKLIENIRNGYTPLDGQREQLDFLQAQNRRHAERHASTIRSSKRASSPSSSPTACSSKRATLSTSASEPPHIRELYGDTLHGRQMLIARRLLEKGVRYVQVWHGAGQPWDNHDDLGVHAPQAGHGERSGDRRPAASDLKQRGLLEDTLVIWGGEFGRTPVVELPTPGANAGKINGRDHNHHGFSMWLAGGGVKGGSVYGATDEFGFKAEVDPVHVHDLHATLLHLLGFDHEKLTYRYAGRDFRLTDVHGQVVKGLLA